MVTQQLVEWKTRHKNQYAWYTGATLILTTQKHIQENKFIAAV